MMNSAADWRLALLIHSPLGLKLEDEDWDTLSRPDLDCRDRKSVEEALRSPGARSFVRENIDWIDASLRLLEKSHKHGVVWTCIGRPDYPANWNFLSRKPHVFSYKGTPCWMNTPLLSVVGSRTPATDSLLWLQRELGVFLKRCGVGVVSGGARGVDQWAHRMSIEAGQPTVCIMPTGLLNPYPFGKEELWRKICDGGGCLISTLSLEEPLRKHNFRDRNRWIAGLSPLCFVVEANRRSGSEMTARMAAEEDREICTLPVFPMACQGLHNLDLIANGAIMLRDHADLLMAWERAIVRVRYEPNSL